jgi:hypothetical protein
MTAPSSKGALGFRTWVPQPDIRQSTRARRVSNLAHRPGGAYGQTDVQRSIEMIRISSRRGLGKTAVVASKPRRSWPGPGVR